MYVLYYSDWYFLERNTKKLLIVATLRSKTKIWEERRIFPFMYFFIIWTAFLPYADTTFSERIIMCMYDYTCLYGVLENPYNLKSREMGPLLDYRKDALQTSLILL